MWHPSCYSWGESRCSGIVRSSYSTCVTRRVTLVINPVMLSLKALAIYPLWVYLIFHYLCLDYAPPFAWKNAVSYQWIGFDVKGYTFLASMIILTYNHHLTFWEGRGDFFSVICKISRFRFRKSPFSLILHFCNSTPNISQRFVFLFWFKLTFISSYSIFINYYYYLLNLTNLAFRSISCGCC